MAKINDLGFYLSSSAVSIGEFGASVKSRSAPYNAWVFSKKTRAGGNSITLYTAAEDFSLQVGTILYTDDILTSRYIASNNLSYSNQYIVTSNGQITSITPCLNAFSWNSYGCNFNNLNTGYVTGANGNIDIGDFLYQNPDSTNPISGTVYLYANVVYYETNGQGEVIAVHACPT